MVEPEPEILVPIQPTYFV